MSEYLTPTNDYENKNNLQSREGSKYSSKNVR